MTIGVLPLGEARASQAIAPFLDETLSPLPSSKSLEAVLYANTLFT